MKRKRLVGFLYNLLSVSLLLCNVATNADIVFAEGSATNDIIIEEQNKDENVEFTNPDEEIIEEEKSDEKDVNEEKKSDITDLENENEGTQTSDEEKLISHTEESEEDQITDDKDDEDNIDNYKNNIGELSYSGDGNWEYTEDGFMSDALGKGDCFAFSKTHGKNFVYSTDIKFLENQGAAALLFRSNGTADNKESYVVNLDASNHKCKFFRWQRNDALQLIDEKSITATSEETYTLKVVAYDSWILYFVNDELVASLGDYYLQPGDLGQDTFIDEGVFGLLNWNSKVIFQNTYYRELNNYFSPLLKDISVKSDNGTIPDKARFLSTEPMMLQYVNNDASEVKIELEKMCPDASIEIKNEDGDLFSVGESIPIKTGINHITVKSTIKDDDGFDASVVYRLNIHRFKNEVEYYNEVYRDQYHYSVKEGWANDPNGLVYYKGTYHMFYQFFDDIKWGPMHWAHATSKDLLHWQEEPIAFYPDANGAMFSGCIVVDDNNTSGLFDSNEGGLVALITADGNGQRIKLAYSEDEGRTWKKLDKVALDWSNDPLHSRDFRDPKVFRWENKWFMVIAGGPLRIYSSDNLRDWTCESTYGDLHTECPDMYPVKASDGTLKWVLSRGGRFYKVGDFRNLDGCWTFIPDDEYKDSDGIMNFGRDSYAAMTYYIQDFGTAANPDIPEIVELNWMNTWDDYCNQIASKVGQDFNGTFNLNLKLGLEMTDAGYALTQTPINEYKKLRETTNKLHIKNLKLKDSADTLKDFNGDTYEIIAKFKPAKNATKVGFKLRKGSNEETIVAYDFNDQKLYIDRSNSGVIISNRFSEVCSQNMSLKEDGSLDLHIFVDKASVEVFSADNKVCGAAQIFANPFSQGIEVFAESGEINADIDIYPIKSIWNDKKEVKDVYAISSMFPSKTRMNCGEKTKIDTYILPVNANQKINWTIKSGEGVIQLSDDGKVEAIKKGTAVVSATSEENPEVSKEFTIEVYENNFKTNVKDFVNLSGNWTVDDETLTVSNVCQNDYYMVKDKINGDYTMKTKINFTKGLINIFLVSPNMNPLEGEGGYTIQFAPDNKVIRFFRFGRDDMFRGQLKAPIGDGKYHNLEIKKKNNNISVFVDDVNSLDYTLEDANDLEEGYVGLGLWDGELNVQTFYVDSKDTEKPAEDKPATPSTNDNKLDISASNSGSSSGSSNSNRASNTTSNNGHTQVKITDEPVAQALPKQEATNKISTKNSSKKPSEKEEQAVIEDLSTKDNSLDEKASEEIKDETVPKAAVETENDSATESIAEESTSNNAVIAILCVLGILLACGLVILMIRKKKM